MNTSRCLVVAAIGLANSLVVANAQTEPELGPHEGKRVLHASDTEELTYKVCNEDPAQKFVKVYVGERAQEQQVKFGECREFKDKRISVDKLERAKDKNSD